MKQTFSIRKINGQWLIFDNTESLDIPFDDGGPEGFTKEECIQTCINLNSVEESDEEKEQKETYAHSFSELLKPVFEMTPVEEVNIEDTIAIVNLLTEENSNLLVI